MECPIKMHFNPSPSYIAHIDLNSCFATIEQQANPLLRGKPVVVAAYTTDRGCILASSIEAKRYGIKTGMRVKDAQVLYPPVIVLPSDPPKYRDVHLALRKLIGSYTNDFYPKSIDEFVLNLEGYPCLVKNDMFWVAKEIKRRIRTEIGEHLSVSIGISTNRYLAKVAAGITKPDGLDEINAKNYLDIYSRLKLTDLCGIKEANMRKLGRMKICSLLDFYNAPLWKLKAAFHSIVGYYWYLRLKGWEIDSTPFVRRSYGNSYALPKPIFKPDAVAPILSKLVEKMSARLRRAGLATSGVHVGCFYKDGTYTHKGMGLERTLFDPRDIYKEIFKIFLKFPPKPIRNLAVSCFNLKHIQSLQLDLFQNEEMKYSLVNSIDTINNRWGDFVVSSGRMLSTQEYVKDRIAFGNVKELEEFTLSA